MVHRDISTVKVKDTELRPIPERSGLINSLFKARRFFRRRLRRPITIGIAEGSRTFKRQADKIASISSDILKRSPALVFGFVKGISKDVIRYGVEKAPEFLETRARLVLDQMNPRNFITDVMSGDIVGRMQEREEMIRRLGREKFEFARRFGVGVRKEIDKLHITEEGRITEGFETVGELAWSIKKFLVPFESLRAAQIVQLQKAKKFTRAAALARGSLKEEFAPAILASIPISMEGARTFNDFAKNMAFNIGGEVAILKAAKVLKPLFNRLKRVGALSERDVVREWKTTVDDLGDAFVEAEGGISKRQILEMGGLEPEELGKVPRREVPEVKAPKAIPKELEPIAVEARKFKTVEEFAQSLSKKPNKKNLIKGNVIQFGERPDAGELISVGKTNVKVKSFFKPRPGAEEIEQILTVKIDDIKNVSEGGFKNIGEITDFFNQAKGIEVPTVKPAPPEGLVPERLRKPELPLPPTEIPTKPKILLAREKKELEKVAFEKRVAEPVEKVKLKVGLAKTIERRAVEARVVKSFEGIPEYEKISIKDQAERATKIFKQDEERAIRIAMGTELPPSGLLPEAVLANIIETATKNKDIDLLLRLGTKSNLLDEATKMGQRIRLLGEINPDSPMASIRKVAKRRIESFEVISKKTISTARKEVKVDIKKKIRKGFPTKEDWNLFVNNIKC